MQAVCGRSARGRYATAARHMLAHMHANVETENAHGPSMPEGGQKKGRDGE